MNLIGPCCTCCSSLQGVKKREQASLMAWRLIFPLQNPKKVITSIPVVSKRCKDQHRNPLDSVPPAVCSDSPGSWFCPVPGCTIHSEFTPMLFQDPFKKRLSILFQAWKVALQKSQFHNKRSIQIQVFPVLQWTSTGTHLASANSSLHALGRLKATQLAANLHLPKWSKYYKVGPDPVLNGLITPENGVITLLIGPITPFITGRGPPCMLGLYWFVSPFQKCNENVSGMPASSPTRYLRGEAVQQSSCKWSPTKREKENHRLKSAGNGWGNMLAMFSNFLVLGCHYFFFGVSAAPSHSSTWLAPMCLSEGCTGSHYFTT